MVFGTSGQMLTADARRAAVLGSPIVHSLSPALHEAAYRALGLTHWSYETHEVRAQALHGFVAALGPEWAGLSLTMPLKEAAFKVADEVSDLAREVGAINTLVRRPDGGWRGDNTDVYGVPQAVQQARRAGLEVEVVELGQLARRVGDIPLVISTLPANVLSADALADLALRSGLALPAHLLLDVVYSGWPSPLARIFQEAGAKVVSGFEMLVHQGAEQVHLMTGLLAPVEQMRAAGLAAMAST